MNRKQREKNRRTPQPAEPAPLTIPQVCDLVSGANLDWQKGWDGDPCEVNRFLKFARAIEAAHGIGAGVKEPGTPASLARQGPVHEEVRPTGEAYDRDE